MYECYLTDELTEDQMVKFIRWFDKNIGTELERQGNTILCMDLEWEEVDKCRMFERKLTA